MQYSRIAKLANRIQSRRAKRGQKGFTLLELLVVVAILAAIAGTATIALQDTDARASAAAHVAMMDELNKGIATFRVLNKNTLPSAFDSLIEAEATTYTPGTAVASTTLLRTVDDGLADALAVVTLPPDAARVLHDGGIKSLMYVSTGFDSTNGPEDSAGLTCANPETLINSRSNNVVPGNIFLSPAANGCGFEAELVYDDPDPTVDPVGVAQPVALWTDNYERILGSAGRVYDEATTAEALVGAPVMMAVGIGPSSTLFENGKLGSMTSVPVYRHVSGAAYNRFVALFTVGTIPTGNSATSIAAAVEAGGYNPIDQVNLVTVIDTAGDTKEEELGEWDGQRNTI